MTRFARPASAILIVAALVAAVVAPVPASGYANNGDNYGTHDWQLDQALKVLDGRVDGWFNAGIARLHTDDPDKTRDRSHNEHVYRGEGRVGGAVDRIAYHYDLAFAAYQNRSYNEASKQIGLMAHYVGDIAEPYHTHIDGIPLGDSAKKFEQLIAQRHRDRNDTPEWSSDRRTVSEIENVRLTAAGTAAHSRQFMHELHDRLKASNFEMTPRISEIIGSVMKRQANDLADMIWSISRGVGRQPALGEIELDIRWTGIAPGDNNLVEIRALDVHGQPIEGLLVFLEWPTADGKRIERMYTLPNGRAKRYGSVGSSPKLVLRPVVATAEIRGNETVVRSGWTISPRLASGGAGWKTKVSDRTVAAGQSITATSIARDGNGRPVPNLLVTFTWDVGGSTIKTTDYTNDKGRAKSTRSIAGGWANNIEITAHTQAGSADRWSSVTINRVD